MTPTETRAQEYLLTHIGSRVGLMAGLAEEERKIMSERKVCVWTESDDDWSQSGCGKHFEFNDDGVVENGFKFCPFCGGTVEVFTEDEK